MNDIEYEIASTTISDLIAALSTKLARQKEIKESTEMYILRLKSRIKKLKSEKLHITDDVIKKANLYAHLLREKLY